MGHPKIKEKSGLRPRLPKNIANIKQKAPKGSQRGAPGGPRIPQGLQNGSQILSKFLKKRGLCPGALQKGAKDTPGPPKILKNEGKLTRTRAQHSQKNRDGEEVFAETRGINRASPSPKIGDGDAPHAMSSEVLSITGTGYLKARWRAGALRPWIWSDITKDPKQGGIQGIRESNQHQLLGSVWNCSCHDCILLTAT